MLSRRHCRNEEEFLFINLTPMIDIIMTLLVFFMTATELADWEENAFDVEVPQVSSADSLSRLPDSLLITIDEEATVRLMKKVVSLSELQEALEKAHENYADQKVVIEADGRTTHQHVADVMSVCHASGIKKISQKVRMVELP